MGLQVAETLIQHGWRDVEVHVVTHDLIVGDPHAFFRSMSEWSAPVRPLTDRLDAAGMDRAAEAFADIVAGSAPEGDRVPFSGLLSIGAPALTSTSSTAPTSCSVTTSPCRSTSIPRAWTSPRRAA